MDDNAVALELGRRILERSSITAADVQAIVVDARRKQAKTDLVTRLKLLAGHNAWSGLDRRESIRRVLSEMDAIELGQDVPVPEKSEPERKTEHASQTNQRKPNPEARQPREENGAHGVKPAVPAHGGQSTGSGSKHSGPATQSKSGT